MFFWSHSDVSFFVAERRLRLAVALQATVMSKLIFVA